MCEFLTLLPGDMYLVEVPSVMEFLETGFGYDVVVFVVYLLWTDSLIVLD